MTTINQILKKLTELDQAENDLYANATGVPSPVFGQNELNSEEKEFFYLIQERKNKLWETPEYTEYSEKLRREASLKFEKKRKLNKLIAVFNFSDLNKFRKYLERRNGIELGNKIFRSYQ